jgi:hypothetical protein
MKTAVSTNPDPSLLSLPLPLVLCSSPIHILKGGEPPGVGSED